MNAAILHASARSESCPQPKPKSPMVHEFTLIFTHGKIIVGTLLVALTGLAEEFFPTGSVESWTSKGLLAAAVIYVMRQLAKEREEAKIDREKFGQARDVREAKLDELITRNLEVQEKLCDKVTAQTSYFERLMMERGFKNGEGK